MTVTWSYPVIMSAAILTGVLLSRRYQRELPMTRGQRIWIGLGAFCGAMIAAKLPFVLAGKEGFFSPLTWLSNGKTILAGLAGGYFGVELSKAAMGVRIKTGDGFAVPVAAAIGVGRLSCFAAGCCYGTPTALPWGVRFAGGGARHPTQIYELIFHLGAALVLDRLRRRGLFKRQLMKLYIIGYALYRFLTEFIRPEPVWLFGLTAYQVAALTLIPIFAGLWMLDWRPSTPENMELPPQAIAK